MKIFFISENDAPKEADISKIVIHSYISPADENLVVSVKKSKPVFGRGKIDVQDLNQLKEASVVIVKNDGSKSIRLRYDNMKKNIQHLQVSLK